MSKQCKKQRGASFVSWMILAAAFVFVLVTVAKIAPVYMEFATVKSMVDEIAADDKISGKNSSRQLRAKLDNYMNVNGLYTVKPEYFSLVKLPEQKNARALQVEYEVRKHWLANIDFTMNFQHAAVLKRQN
ncbi:MAG: DUF4845 domain-containing protein [Thiolinea sp.]